MGKPKNDLLDGHLTWTGSYAECITIEAEVNDSGNVISPYTGHYCTASFQLAQPSQVEFILRIVSLFEWWNNAWRFFMYDVFKVIWRWRI